MHRKASQELQDPILIQRFQLACESTSSRIVVGEDARALELGMHVGIDLCQVGVVTQTDPYSSPGPRNARPSRANSSIPGLVPPDLQVVRFIHVEDILRAEKRKRC